MKYKKMDINCIYGQIGRIYLWFIQYFQRQITVAHITILELY
jgi:hypothetical protein